MVAWDTSICIPATAAVMAGTFLSGKRLDTGISIASILTDLTSGRSGAMMSLFLLTIPVIQDSSTSTTQLLRQWNLVFYKGHIQGPLIAIATGTVHILTAWRSGERLFAVSGAITVSMIPYTWIFMRGVNDALFAASEWADEIKEGKSENLRQLVNSWSRFNAVRALFPLAGSIMGMILLLGR
ncbi:Noranthrone monooxygenase [Lecanosticta acicola]|uniref:Noranthrone monooxygenase n=1 Tax=Lecanosticta acicola TaxID=111012 RepID=A0AAI9EDX5_9PEZI|nr:Noranthrone monooxygenase [Lecanosticta acicola]